MIGHGTAFIILEKFGRVGGGRGGEEVLSFNWPEVVRDLKLNFKTLH